MAAPQDHRKGITIRSYRVVFRLERRLHKVDRWRIPVPYGLQLRGVAYFAAVLAAVVLVGRLPAAGELLAVLPAPLRFVVGPIAVAFALTRLSPDGRAA